MIYIILGTRAQLVKMAPLILEFEQQKQIITLIHTGQHKESFFELSNRFKIQSTWNPFYVSKQEVKTVNHAIIWLIKISFRILFSPSTLLFRFNNKNKNLIIVHGDTFSTVLGALLGKRLGIKVAHIESGLRSFNLFNPFPEELNRLLTFRLTDLAFCPGEWAANNMHQYKQLKIINTKHNTLLDTLNIALNSSKDQDYPIPKQQYGVVSIHRFENIFFTQSLTKIVDQLVTISQSSLLIFVLHPATVKRLNKTDLIKKLQAAPNIELRSRTDYHNFIRLLQNSHFVITDGGSNQEELSYLKIPTFLMRKTTERQEGLQSNVVLGELSEIHLANFIKNLKPVKAQYTPALANGPSHQIYKEINQFLNLK